MMPHNKSVIYFQLDGEVEAQFYNLIGCPIALLHCPLSQQILEDPVIISDGWTYSRAVLDQFLNELAQKNLPPYSPKTGERLLLDTNGSVDLRVNYAIRDILEGYRTQLKNSQQIYPVTTDNFLCPIQFDLLENPMVPKDGRTYSLSTLKSILSSEYAVLPFCKTPIDECYENKLLKKFIQEFLRQKGWFIGINEKCLIQAIQWLLFGNMQPFWTWIQHPDQDKWLFSPLNQSGDTLAMMAAYADQVAVLEYLLNKGLSLTQVNHQGITVLHYAVTSSGHTVFDWLLSKTIDLEVKTNGGFTALHCAALKNDHYKIQQLLQSDADINAVTQDGKNVMLCVASKNLELVNYFLDKGVNPTQVDNENNTLLHLLAANKAFDIKYYKPILNKISLSNHSANQVGMTPLHAAVACNNYALCQWYLEQEQQGRVNWLNSQDRRGMTPVMYASAVMTKLLLRYRPNLDLMSFRSCATVFTLTVCQRNLAKMQLLMQHLEGSLEFIDQDQTLIDIAVQHKAHNILNYWSQQPRLDSSGNNFFHILALSKLRLPIQAYRNSWSHLSKIELIQQLNTTNLLGMTPLFNAMLCDNHALVHAMIASGSDIHAKDAEGKSLLYYAVSFGYPDIVRDLLMLGVDPNASTTSHVGNSALHFAAIQGNIEIFDALAYYGADILMENHAGWTPMQLLMVQRSQKIKDYLHCFPSVYSRSLSEEFLDYTQRSRQRSLFQSAKRRLS